MYINRVGGKRFSSNKGMIMNETKIKIGDETIEISSEFLGEKTSSWGSIHHNKVSVTVLGSTIRFDYWGSDAAPNISSKEDLLTAFSNFMSDAIAYEESYEDFCDTFGYEPYCEEDEDEDEECDARKTYDLCGISNATFKLLPLDNDVYYYINYLNENYDI